MNARISSQREVLVDGRLMAEVTIRAQFNPRSDLISSFDGRQFSSKRIRSAYFSLAAQAFLTIFIVEWK